MIPLTSELDVASLPPIWPTIVSSCAGAAITKATHIMQRATYDEKFTIFFHEIIVNFFFSVKIQNE